jgi:CPA2 family monovalent cation:H+ antiporter-2
MVLAESELSHRAAEDSLPLRDAFAVLFFVSVGMLFDPVVLVERPLAVLATVLIIVVGKSVAAYGIVRAFGYPNAQALTISASLAQIGEFSFILASLGVGLGLMSAEAQDLILGGAIVSIVLNPLLFGAIDRMGARTPPPAAPPDPTSGTLTQSYAARHAVVVGFGMVGRNLVAEMQAEGRPFLVIDDREEEMARLRAAGVEALTGNAADANVLDAANVAHADWLFVAIPNVFEAGQVIEKARRVNADLRIAARAENETELAHLRERGADEVVIGRREIALGMLSQAFGDGERDAGAAPG